MIISLQSHFQQYWIFHIDERNKSKQIDIIETHTLNTSISKVTGNVASLIDLRLSGISAQAYNIGLRISYEPHVLPKQLIIIRLKKRKEKRTTKTRSGGQKTSCEMIFFFLFLSQGAT